MKKKVIIDMPATAAAGSNPYLDADKHVNVEKINKLQAQIKAALKDVPTVNEKGKAIKPPKPIATFTIKRNAKVTPYSRGSENKGDLRYLARRAVLINTARSLTERAAVKKMALLTQYDADVIGDKLAKAAALAAKAIATHQKQTDKTKAGVKKVKEKNKAANDKAFAVALKKVNELLEAADIDPKKTVMSTGMGGSKLLVNLGGDSVVAIMRSDMTAFKAAKKAATA